jgi:selenium metabolism protein YedF
MRIDCCNLACPEPVIRTKKALEELQNDAILEVLVNSVASIENVKRFAKNSGYEFREEKIDKDKTLITIIKGYECSIAPKNENLLNKTLFIKDDKVGEGELGFILIKGFLKTLLEFKNLPKNIVLVNRGVFLTTKEENQEVIDILKELQKKGVNIYSCGLCLNFYNIDASELKVGEIGNAYDSMDMLLNTDSVTL